MALTTAMSKHDYERRFEQECKMMYDKALMNGDFKNAEEIRRFYEERKYDMDGDMMNSILGQSIITGLGVGQIGAANNASGIYQNALMQQQYTQAAQASSLMDFVPEFGVLYLNSKELPAEWAGAKITEFQRQVRPKHWYVYFTSKWDKTLEIHLYLNIEEHNGAEVNAMAATYMEALNQRRMG